MSELKTQGTPPGVVITLRLPLEMGAVARLMNAVADVWPDARIDDGADTGLMTILACMDVPTPIVAYPPPGYSIVRTDELEAAITAYLANDDKGLRGAMADLSATPEGTKPTWRMHVDPRTMTTGGLLNATTAFWTDRRVSELIADAGAEPVENPADLELQGISDESWAALETMQEERS